MKYQQIPSIIGVIDRVGLSTPIPPDNLRIPNTIIGGVRYNMPLTPKKYEIQFDGYWYPSLYPAKVFSIPFLIFDTTKGKHNCRVNPWFRSDELYIAYFADTEFFEHLFAKRCSKKESEYFIVGGYQGDYNMYVTRDVLQAEIVSLHNRMISRIKACATRNRKIAHKRGTYVYDIAYGKYPRSTPDIQYMIIYHKMSIEDLFAYYLYLPPPYYTLEYYCHKVIHDMVAHLLDE